MLPCTLFAIDAWTPEASGEGTQDQANRDWWDNQDYHAAMGSFLNSIENFNVVNVVTVVINRSEDCMEFIPMHIDVLHIDGNHTPEKAVQDVELYLPRVKPGGWVIMDDSKWPSTQPAVQKLSVECNLEFEFDEGGQSFNVYRKQYE